MAVCLLFSFLRPEHEKKRVGEILAELDLPVSLSHEILAEFREFERTSTTVVNAYVSPIMTRYLTGSPDGHRRAMRCRSCNPTAAPFRQTRPCASPCAPSSPVRPEARWAHWNSDALAGFDKIITFDMGGTSTDVSLMDGALPLTMQSSIAGYPVKVPMIDIHTVGAGGGSMASPRPGRLPGRRARERRRGPGPGLLRPGRHHGHGHGRQSLPGPHRARIFPGRGHGHWTNPPRTPSR